MLSKDPTGFLLLFEDGASVLGLLVVFVLMVLNHAYNIPALDGVASVIVGLILIVASLILARESRSLLMGEGIALATREKIKALVEQDETVINVNSIFSTYEAPEEVILMLVVTFKSGLHTDEITNAIKRIRHGIKKQFKKIEFVIVQPRSDEAIPEDLKYSD